jgi:glyoxylase-like metal-dependent hydrolase (beta-lactamase superfamily II)
MDGMSGRSLRGRLACHCLLLEDSGALILVDTGYGLRDVAHPESRLSPLFRSLLKPDLREEMTAIRQIERLGFDPRDVRHILLSHLDFDHAGGLDDFPDATVHLLSDELHAALRRSTLLDRMRYRPQQWKTRTKWKTYAPASGESWYGFSRVHALDGIKSDVVLLPLAGHTSGHAGVAARQGERWLLYAGDAYFYHGEMATERPHCTPGLAIYQTLMEKNRKLRLSNQQQLRELARSSSDVTIFCSHDAREFEALSHRSMSLPAPSTRSKLTNGGSAHPVFGLGATWGQADPASGKGHPPP